MFVAIASMKIDLMMVEVIIRETRTNLCGHEGETMCRVHPIGGRGSTWIPRRDLYGYKEIIKPCLSTNRPESAQ